MNITDGPLEQALLFCICSMGSMIVAYVKIWANETDGLDVKLWTYLTGDKKAVARAFTSLFALWAGASGFSYLSGLSDQEIVGAAIGVGLLVPQRAQQSKPVTLK